MFAVLWKDLLVRWNHKVATLCEILIPVVFLLSMRFFRRELTLEKGPIKQHEIVMADDTCHAPHLWQMHIIFGPSEDWVIELMKKAVCLGALDGTMVVADYIQDPASTDYVFAVNFESNDPVLKYTIYPTRPVWNSFDIERFDHFSKNNFFSDDFRSLLQLQNAIGLAFLDQPHTPVHHFNYSQLTKNEVNPTLLTIMFFSFLVIYAVMSVTIVGRIVEEKGSGVKELMHMMGVGRWEYWFCKFLECTIIHIIMASAYTMILCIPTDKEEVFYFRHIEWYVVWLYFLLGLSSCAVSLFLYSCFFISTFRSMFLICILWLITHLFVNWLTAADFGFLPPLKYATLLFPHLCFFEGVIILMRFESLEKKIDFLGTVSGNDVYLTLACIVAMLMFDLLVYGLLTAYIDLIRPGPYGVKRRPFFCCGSKHKEQAVGRRNIPYGGELFEIPPHNLTAGITMLEISKQYHFRSGNIIAVKDFTLDFFKGEITALLGGSGAGKTTTFMMISGLTQPSSGKIYINGYDAAVHPQHARRSVGFCPQHDMLFPDLTPYQTLKFFGRVKGLRTHEAKTQTLALLMKLQISHVANTKNHNLTSGQKRKVSVAVALIGQNDIIVLDEPTSGVDPEVRKEIWKMILEIRPTRTILLTTHLMDEADALSDRVAIMDHGLIKCYGTPSFLKKKLGTGYVLSVQLAHKDRAKLVFDTVRSYLASATLKSETNYSLCFSLIDDEVRSFPYLLKGMKRLRDNGDVLSYTLSMSTLEEVFMRFDKRLWAEDRVKKGTYAGIDSPDDMSYAEPFCITQWWRQFWGLLIKNFWLCIRNLLNLAIFFGIPIIIWVIVAQLSRFQITTGDVKFTLELYPDSSIIYKATDDLIGFEDVILDMDGTVERVDNVRKELDQLFEEDYRTAIRETLFAIDFDPNPTTVIYFNQHRTFAMPVTLNTLHNAISNGPQILPSFSFVRVRRSLRDDPPSKSNDAEERNCPEAINVYILAFHCIYFLLILMEEKVHGGKELQILSSSFFNYWVTHLLFDLILSLFYTMLCISIYYAIYRVERDLISFAILGTFLWAMSQLLVSYIVSCIAKAQAYALTILILIIVISSSSASLEGVYYMDYLRYLNPTPLYSSGWIRYCTRNDESFVRDLGIYIIFELLILFVLEFKAFSVGFHQILSTICQPEYEFFYRKDESVEEERENVARLIEDGDYGENVLIAHNLRRWFGFFGRRPIVRGVNFHIPKGECFGLLGVSGAGKTTTLRMIASVLAPSEGNCYINGVTMLKCWCPSTSYAPQFGYCPKYGRGLVPCLTGREQLKLFARLRGLPANAVNHEVMKWSHNLLLKDYLDKRCGRYSGGVQRKLSTGIAMVGDPRIIILDEPTEGVDSVQKRSLWSAIHTARNAGQSILLTTHNMEECESLCSKMAIMRKGEFQIIGRLMTLKEKFGQGSSIKVMLYRSAREDEVRDIKYAIESGFSPGCELIDEHMTILEYHITNVNVTLSEVFIKLDDMKTKFKAIESYSAGSTSLDQVFTKLAREN